MSEVSKEINTTKPEETPDTGAIHYLTFPFAIGERPDGGLPAVIMNEARNSAGKKVVMFSADKQNIDNFDGVKVVAADNPIFSEDLVKIWFGNGYWPLLHPKAHTAEAVTPECLKAMYDKSAVDLLLQELDAASINGRELPKVGSQKFLVEYVDRFGPDIKASAQFNKAFENVVISELEKARLSNEKVCFNFQDYFFHNLVEVVAPQVREANGLSTYHLHTTIPHIPDDIKMPKLIAAVAQAASKSDVVLTHTEIYNERLRNILDRLKLKHPEYRTFALGIDEADLAQREGKVTVGNYIEAVPSFENLTERQKKLVHAAFKSEAEGVPHQFGIYDRMDPIKGIDTVFQAIDKFLGQERSDTSFECVKNKYRFFAVMSQFYDSAKFNDKFDLRQAYAKYVFNLGSQLEAKWPGIFMMSEGFGGKYRDLIVALMRDRSVITGGAEDGLNQVVMESSFINRNNPTALIAGENIGFVIEMARAGLRDNLYAFKPGNVSDLTNQIRQVAVCQEKHPGHLVLQKSELNRVIASRNASMLVDN
jgi:hypothetical protein